MTRREDSWVYRPALTLYLCPSDVDLHAICYASHLLPSIHRRSRRALDLFSSSQDPIPVHPPLTWAKGAPVIFARSDHLPAPTIRTFSTPLESLPLGPFSHATRPRSSASRLSLHTPQCRLFAVEFGNFEFPGSTDMTEKEGAMPKVPGGRMALGEGPSLNADCRGSAISRYFKPLNKTFERTEMSR